MKTYLRLLVFLGLMLLLTSLISPWAAMLWQWFIESRPDWQEHRLPFSSFFNRTFIAVGILLFFFCPSLLRIRSLGQLGLSSFRRQYPDVIRGFVLSLASVVALVFLMSFAGVYTFFFRLSLPASLERIATALLSAVAAGFLEELFFRGILLKGLLQDSRPASALIGVSLFYSAIHFVKPEEKVFLIGIDPWAGFVHLGGIFQPFLDPAALLPGLIGLFLIGFALGYALIRTGSLYLSIGLHAGWIFGLKTIRVYGDFRRPNLGWFFGSSEPKIVSGVATWMGVVMVVMIVHWMTRTPRKS